MASDSGGALRELLAYFTVEVDDKELKEFDKGITGAIEKLQDLGKGFAVFLGLREVKEFFAHTIEQAAGLEDMSLKLGVGTDALQKFQFAASLHGVEDGGQLLGRLNRQIGAAAEGAGDGAEEFAKFHVKLKDDNGNVRDTMDVIDDLADAFKDMKSAPERSAAAMQFFGRQGLALIPLLQGGKEELHKVYGEFEGLGGMMSEEFIHASHEADDEMKKLDVTFQGVRIRIVNAVLPSIISLLRGFKDLVVGAQKVIDKSNGIKHAFEFLKILAVVALVWKLTSAMRSLAAAETLADAVNPFTLALLAIGALYLAYDDLKTALEGGKSVFGNAFGAEGVNHLREALSATKVVLQSLWDIARGFLNTLNVAYKSVKVVYTAATGGDVGAAMGEVSDAMDGVTNAAGDLVHHFRQGVGLDDQDAAPYVAPSGKTYKRGKITGGPVIDGQEYTNPMTEGGGFNMEADSAIKAAEMQATTMPAPKSSTTNNAPVSITQHNTVKVAVTHTSGQDPDVVGKAIGIGAQKELDKAMLNSLNAVKTQ